ncbi:hypothetical protein [Cetobacterium sp.]|uniref:hypothetical protein n=1 Tax=Cetobacterium sp. TaxID=2071632 RepID=UPI003F2C3529
MLLEYPIAYDISDCHLTKLTNLLSKTSKGKYGKDKAIALKELLIQMKTPLMSILGISYTLGSIILSEIGNHTSYAFSCNA